MFDQYHKAKTHTFTKQVEKLRLWARNWRIHGEQGQVSEKRAVLSYNLITDFEYHHSHSPI
jgi:hypothetical protein